MKVYLGLLESSRPDQTRIFGELEDKLFDVNLACAAHLSQSPAERASAYALADFYFPKNIQGFLERGECARKMFDQVTAFAQTQGASKLRGPGGEKVVYEITEIRVLPPLQKPNKSFVIGFSDRARAETLPRAEIPTAYYKLPQTLIADGAPILWPKFSQELDADGCFALVIGKPGRRIPAEKAWEYIAGVTLMVDLTARDINRREGLTTNNLLGKNFPSSTCLGPAVLIGAARDTIEAMELELVLDGETKGRFSLSNCVFTVEQIIARWSILGINPGDWLAIGASMALSGDQLHPPVPLKIGSTIRCSSPLIGTLSHRVFSA